MASRLIVPAIFVRHDDRYSPKRKIRITIHLHKQLNRFDLMFQMTNSPVVTVTTVTESTIEEVVIVTPSRSLAHDDKDVNCQDDQQSCSVADGTRALRPISERDVLYFVVIQ